MGIFDKAKDAAGKAKDKVDDLVEQNADKIPDDIEKKYDKASDAAEKHVPGDKSKDAPAHEQVIRDT